MDYAQSRLQARFGEFPDELLWQKLEGATDPASALETARSCGLRRWVASVTPHASSHEIEITLRTRWRECVTEIASWMPCNWQAALLWTRELPDLSALVYLARGATPLPWMLDDPVLQVYSRADPTTRAVLLREDYRTLLGSSFERLEHSVQHGVPGRSRLGQVWLDEWQRRWPRWIDSDALKELTTLLDAALGQPARTARPVLLRKLRALFRRSVLHPVVVFIYLAFAAIDLQRLRAALLKHALAHEGRIPS